MKVRIANPLYDSVFKLLMEDAPIARQFLSLLLNAEITELSIHSQEKAYLRKSGSVHAKEGSVRVYRVDFNATVLFPDGQRRVLIELQKAMSGRVVGRFRKYLGAFYSVDPQSAREREAAEHLPIIAVYLLGFQLPATLSPVVRVERRYLNGSTGEILKGAREPFIECLTHDAVLVQIPLINSQVPPANDLERVLQIFDQHHREGEESEEAKHPRTMLVDESLGEGQPLLQKMLLLLATAAADDETREQMALEEEATSIEEDLEEALKGKEVERAQKEAAMAREAEALKEIAAMRERIEQLSQTAAASTPPELPGDVRSDARPNKA